MAKIIANYADDLPMVDVVAHEEFGAVKSIGDAYQWSTEDLRAAAMSGRPLPERRRRAARRAFDRRVDDIAARGDAKAKLPGILTNPNLPVITAANPASGTDTEWNAGDKTNLEILEDLFELTDRPFIETHEEHSATSLLLPPSRLTFLERTPLSVDNSETLLSYFKKNTRSVREIAGWHKLETAGEDGGPAALAYERNPEVLEIVLPLPFTEREPQARNLAFVVNCEGKIGGVVLYKPLATVRMDGI
jgi:hypothetical protein